ncbi:PHP domain-containing protein [Sedimentibacter sp. zth1]|uniref:PHP domain-containing protein n=1 Tax=Sedimentibacter sp. zth1 TaxID=2816908 RepID=UPI001A91A855|nr:PHP domain-containing protein [Sedimentibacter sp. zth1]QSX06201.1 PHP domain-containing protein [Sedimentibacter sp. zth1]
MKYYYDFHIHSDLSPCGDSDMTPNNIANMALIKGLNFIAVTDHNSVNNSKAVEIVANKLGLNTLCGMEITTREEIHLLSYFKNYEDAKVVSDLIYESLPNIRNKPEYFGEQNIYNEYDEIIGTVDKLLLSASKYTLNEISNLVFKYDGIIVPAHVNKLNNGILGVLGFFPSDLKCNFIEIYKNNVNNDNKLLNESAYKVLYNSDAHYLKDISEPINYIYIDKNKSIYDYLCFSM